MNRKLFSTLGGLWLFAGMMAFIGCDDDETDSAPVFNVSEKEKAFASEAGNYAVAVFSNMEWTAAKEGDWFTIDKSGGSGNGVVKIVAEANTTQEMREGVITLKSGELTEIVKLTQSAFSVILNVLGENAYEVKPEGGNLSVQVEANVDYTFELTPWVTVPVAGYAAVQSTILLQIAPNLSVNQREAKLLIKNKKTEAVVKEIRLVQGALELKLEKELYTANPLGQSLDIPLVATTDWEIVDPFEGREADRWFTASKGENGIQLTVSKNMKLEEKSELVKVRVTESKYETGFVVKQEKRQKINVDVTYLELTCDDGVSDIILVTADDTWKVEKGEEDTWFEITPVEGGFTIKYQKNGDLTTARHTTLKVIMEDETSFVEVGVYQPKYTDPLNLSPLVVTADDKAQAKTVRINEARGTLSVSSESGWFTPTLEDGYISIDIRANDGEERTDSVKVTLRQGEVEVATKIIKVTQAKKATEEPSITIDQTEIVITRNVTLLNATFDVEVTANVEWDFIVGSPTKHWKVEKISETLIRVTYIDVLVSKPAGKSEVYIGKKEDAPFYNSENSLAIFKIKDARSL